MLPRGKFLLDHSSSCVGGKEAPMSMASPSAGGMRKRGSSTALSLLLKSSMFRQLVENSDAEEGVRAAAAGGAAHPGQGDAYDYEHHFSRERHLRRDRRVLRRWRGVGWAGMGLGISSLQ